MRQIVSEMLVRLGATVTDGDDPDVVIQDGDGEGDVGVPYIQLKTPYDPRSSLHNAVVLHKPVRPDALWRALERTLGAEPPVPAVEPAPARRRRVLVAEDNGVNQMVALRMLERLHCNVDLAEDGAKAIEMAANHTYDLVLMDCQMPVMDGYEAARRLKAANADGLPIVALTANVMDADRARCFAAGMDAVLRKPICIDELRDALDRWAS
jgi:CheY-like chemotaxis protein